MAPSLSKMQSQRLDSTSITPIWIWYRRLILCRLWDRRLVPCRINLTERRGCAARHGNHRVAGSGVVGGGVQNQTSQMGTGSWTRLMQNMELLSPTQMEDESDFITPMHFHDPNMSRTEWAALRQILTLVDHPMIQRLPHSLTALKRHLSRELPLLPMRKRYSTCCREDRNREGTSKVNPD
jgi:hypothetical protein